MKTNSEIADELSNQAAQISSNASLWLDYPYSAHVAHEKAANAHDLAVGETQCEFDRNRHKVSAKEHRYAAEYWARKELEMSHNKLPKN